MIEQWDYFELSLRAQINGNPFTDVSFSADFSCENSRIHASGFYDGADIFKVRFMPGREGTWQYVTHSNFPALDGHIGTFVCSAPSARNHGPVRVADQTHFGYEDGTPYQPVGTTCYVWNLQGDELEAKTLETLDKAPFNKMRMCVFPKRYTFNANEPPSYPFAGQVTREWPKENLSNYSFHTPPDDWDFSRFNPAYFQHLEQRILDLRERGIEADLIVFHPYDFGAWGFDQMPVEVNDRYLTYLVARLSAFRNVWWSLANEYDLFFYRGLEEWDHYFQVIQAADPYNHLRSIHNARPFYDHTLPWVTHCSVQHGDLAQMPVWLAKYHKPVVVDECGYEGNIPNGWGSLSAEELVMRFWTGFCYGGYVGHGETYLNEREELWWSKGGVLTGESVARIAFLRQVFEQAPVLTAMVRLDAAQLAEAGEETRRQFEADHNFIGKFWNFVAGGRHAEEFYLIYYGMHQPRRIFNLPEGSYRIDIIDTWNMTVDPWSEHASGQVSIDLPGRKYLAIRIQRNR
jgi:hypothetical protein